MFPLKNLARKGLRCHMPVSVTASGWAPLPELMLTYCQLDHDQQPSLEMILKMSSANVSLFV